MKPRREDRISLPRSGLSSPILKQSLDHIKRSSGSLKLLESINSETSRNYVRKLAGNANFILKSDQDKYLHFLNSSNGISYPFDSAHKKYKDQEVRSLYETLRLYPMVNSRKLPTEISKLKNLSPVFPELTYIDRVQWSEKSLIEKNLHGLPAGRKDVQLLEEWLDNMEYQINHSEDLETDSILESKKLVYNTCFMEIARQVSVHCIERGKLMQRVWNSYITDLENSLENNQKKSNELKNDFNRNMHVTQSQYRQMLDNLNGKVAKLQLEIPFLKSELKEKEEQLVLSNINEHQLLDKVQLLTRIYQDHTIKLLALTSGQGLHNLLNHSEDLLNSQYDMQDSDKISSLLKEVYELDLMQIPYEELRSTIDNLSKIYLACSINLLLEQQDERIKSSASLKVDAATNTDDFPLSKDLKNSKYSKQTSMTDSDFMLIAKRSIRDLEGVNIRELSSALDMMEDDIDAIYQETDHTSQGIQTQLTSISDLIDNMRSCLNTMNEDPLDSNQIMQSVYHRLFHKQPRDSLQEEQGDSSEDNSDTNEFEEDTTDIQSRNKLWKYISRRFKGRRRYVNMVDTIARRVKSTSVNKLNQIMTKKMLMNYIDGIYIKLCEAHNSNQYLEHKNLSDFIESSLIKNYGIRKVVAKRIEQILSSCIKFQDHPRIFLFGRFLNLHEPLSSKELEVAVSIYESLTKTHYVKSMNNVSIGQITYSPFNRAVDSFKQFLQPKINAPYYHDFITQLNSTKIPDPQSIHKEGLIDIDSSLNLSMSFLTSKNVRDLLFIRNIYDAADVIFT